MVWNIRVQLLSAALVTLCQACVRERHFQPSELTKRQATPLAPLSPEEKILVDSVSNISISEWSYYYTHGYHVAGKNMTMAEWTADRFSENGWNASVVSYNVYLNYPVNKSLSLTYPNGSIFQPLLEEAVLDADETTSYPNRVPTFHGYSASGSAEAEFVYVGRGQQDDFARLKELGVPLEGKIAVSRYGGPFRGLKVKNAQENGMIGAILFTDTGDDGNITEANGYAAYPDGPARNPTSVQRGSVQYLSIYPGDPTTPGYPSRKDSPRADTRAVKPMIPSIPVSYVDAIPILAALDGHGVDGEAVNRTRWVGALNVSYSTGPAPGATISMSNLMEDAYTDIWDTIGIINGTNPDETVVIGNHRDAWIIGGGADPNSGTAIIVELSRAFGKLLAQGWRPKRNIVLCSWDAEEYGLVGSTEWVEEYIPWLTDTAVSYLNIDVGASGAWPYISATPELHQISTDVMKKVPWMDTNRTMYDAWLEYAGGSVGVLGSGSDYTAFVHKGIGSIDMGANGGSDDPVYHYHSNYDSYHWMSNFGDPGFLAHKYMTKYLTLLAYNLATAESLPLNVSNWVTQMETYYDDLLSTINSTSNTLDISSLRSALDEFAAGSRDITALEQQAVATQDPDLTILVNHKKRDFQRGFVSQGGLPNREFYQNLIFAPGLDTGYAPTTFPGITEAFLAGNVSLAAEYVKKTADAILVAANIIKT
ncbi:N-acetylated-alpha-linked acidic dipeptidase-like protein 2 [Xylaria bambusicola]|uniref:N-acetylated-alpha-linked acidic dipeptidase-like protein 2 n=1 Tax=Xylaria bambusicola TaxID=326684 RepID=UPI002008539A|nr:N-acetylated-alpha-linked acidic dipeptidase-like protein 2 [Xylaria bambusicola]KAI0516764.1 N-acetylated-alpha-linked acidic dipeptidase-like protein 2 [Xylaria bambusicola]